MKAGAFTPAIPRRRPVRRMCRSMKAGAFTPAILGPGDEMCLAQ